MEENEKQKDVIYMLRSNHFVEEYLEQKEIAPEIKRNPRYQSIIWHISVMLKRQGIDFTKEEAIKWIDENIKIGKQGEVLYAISESDGYYPINAAPAIQFVKYFHDKDGMKRMVKEVKEQGEERQFIIISNYNKDGIEESQVVYDKYGISIVERVKNRPELKRISTYDKNEKEIKKIEHEQRILWVALEDLAPNKIEIDPIDIYPFLKNGSFGCHTYTGLSYEEEKHIQDAKYRILPLPQKNREEQLQDYKTLNERYHRTKVFELGIAKMLSVRNRDRAQ